MSLEDNEQHTAGNLREEGEGEEDLAEMDEVYQLLDRLEKAKDSKESKEVMKEIDNHLHKRQSGSKEIPDLDACQAGFSKTSLSGSLHKERKAEKLKQMGNDFFSKGDYPRAAELYTSSILEDDSNPLVFTNRAQARIHLGQFNAAVEDCRQAIKLKPELVKAQIHLARALKGRGDFQQAIDVLEIAEESSTGYEDVLKKYKEDVIAQMKHSLLARVGSKGSADRDKP